MNRVAIGEPVRSTHINAIQGAIEAAYQPGDTTQPGSPYRRHQLYFPLPDFAGALTINGVASVAPGNVYVNGIPVTGDDLPGRHTSIRMYAAYSTHPATEGATAWLWGYAHLDPEQGLDAEFRIHWSESPSTPPDPPGVIEEYHRYVLPILEIRHNNAGVPYIHQYFTGPQYITIPTDAADIPLAQFHPSSIESDNTTGLIAGFTTDPENGSGSITDGVIHFPIASHNAPGGTPDTPGLINGISTASGIESPRINKGVIEIPEPTSTDAPLGLLLSSGTEIDLSAASPSTLYKLHGLDKNTSGYQIVYAASTYAHITRGAHASYLSIYTLTGNEYITTSATLDTIATVLTGLTLQT